MKYYLIAGEASGDLHGSNLMHELKKYDPGAKFRYFGGDLMKAQGGTLVKHCRDMAFMGILNVAKNLNSIRRNMKFCQKDLLEYQPDVLILIDYPGFNLRIAKFAKQNNLRVFYYISPKVWAWKEFRVKEIRKYVDEMFTILPFETEYFKKHHIDVHYVGNPLLDSIEQFKCKAPSREAFLNQNNLDDRPIVALLAGSRLHEIKKTLPVMKKAAACYPEFQFVIAGVNYVKPETYEKTGAGMPIPVLYDQTYPLLSHAHTALVTSGTATLKQLYLMFPKPSSTGLKVAGCFMSL